MRVAILHDRLVEFGGGEQVFQSLLGMWPRADLFTMVRDPKGHCALLTDGRKVTTSFVQGLPFGARHYRLYLPLMPFAVEQLDFSDYDLVLSSSYAVAKGALTGPDQVHVSYIHSPLRYAWDMQAEYFRGSKRRGLRGLAARLVLHYWRGWDYRSAQSVDSMACNSQFVARRIRKMYRREAAVIYPPVDLSDLAPADERGNYFLTVSRLVPYKRVDVILEAFRGLPQEQLVVVGDGPEAARLARRAPPNVTFLGWQTREQLISLYSRARAFLYAAREDFGISLVEAQACGAPVIAFRGGGALETVVEGITGLFYDEQTPTALGDAIRRFESAPHAWVAVDLLAQARRFSKERFASEFGYHVQQALAEHGNS